MSGDPNPRAQRVGVCLLLLAPLFFGLGLLCLVFDPLYNNGMAAQSLGSLFSVLAAIGSVATAVVLGMIGLSLTKSYLLMLGLANGIALIAIVLFLINYHGDFPRFIFTGRWAFFLALVIASFFLSRRMVALWRKR